ncbi:MAG: Glu/Leu/Phe/Val dehydrogenase dimerization domain-containing protein [Bradymonadia bacterium]
MDTLSLMQRHGLEQIVSVHDPATGLLGCIVIHDTTRGPAIGGTRLYRYADPSMALDDAIELAVAMTRKCALAGLGAGGGKGVIIDHPGITDRAAMFAAYGRYVDSLQGRFYTSGDLGVTADDLRHMRKSTRFVAVPDEQDLNLAGAEAKGILAGMSATLEVTGHGADLQGARVVVQGLGAMGYGVASRLVEAGAEVLGSDLNEKRLQRAVQHLGLKPLPAATVYTTEADVFCPCATSAVLTPDVARSLKVKAVVGAANNQLFNDEADHIMMDRGVRYAPDFAVNSGAVILGATHYLEHRTDWIETAQHAAGRIRESVARIFNESDASGEPPGAVAMRLADEALVRPRSTDVQWWPIH